MPPHIRLAAFAALSAIASGAVAQQSGNAANPAQPRTRAQVTQGLNTQFSRFDTNRDGSLSKAELDAAEARAAQQRAAAIQSRMDAEFTRLDANRDGQLSKAEFMAGAPQPRAVSTDTVIRQLDANRDGKITLQEFSAPTLATFDRVDTNRDGTISAQERPAARRR